MQYASGAKLIGSLIVYIPIGFILFMIVGGIFTGINMMISTKRKTTWLEKHGFVKYVSGVSSRDESRVFHAWRNEQTNKVIDVRELADMSFDEMVLKMTDNHNKRGE